MCFWQCYQKNNDGLGRIFRKTCWVFLITSNRYFICPNKFLERFFRRQHYHLSSKSQANSPPAACRPLMTRPQPFPVTPRDRNVGRWSPGPCIFTGKKWAARLSRIQTGHLFHFGAYSLWGRRLKAWKTTSTFVLCLLRVTSCIFPKSSCCKPSDTADKAVCSSSFTTASCS